MLAGTRRFSRFGMTLVGLLLALVAFAPAAQADQYDPADWAPNIWSDKADYAPGELVTLTGANWQAGETVNIVVNDDQGETWRRDVDVTADATGGITDSFNLPNSSWRCTASRRPGAPRAPSRPTSFTDGNVKIAVRRVARHFDYKVTLYSGSTSCGGTSGGGAHEDRGSRTARRRASAATSRSDRGKPERATRRTRTATFKEWTLGSVVLAAGYSATDRIICVVGFQSGSRDLIGVYNANNAPVAIGQSVSTTEDAAPLSITLTRD